MAMLALTLSEALTIAGLALTAGVIIVGVIRWLLKKPKQENADDQEMGDRKVDRAYQHFNTAQREEHTGLLDDIAHNTERTAKHLEAQAQSPPPVLPPAPRLPAVIDFRFELPQGMDPNDQQFKPYLVAHLTARDADAEIRDVYIETDSPELRPDWVNDGFNGWVAAKPFEKLLPKDKTFTMFFTRRIAETPEGTPYFIPHNYYGGEWAAIENARCVVVKLLGNVRRDSPSNMTLKELSNWVRAYRSCGGPRRAGESGGTFKSGGTVERFPR